MSGDSQQDPLLGQVPDRPRSDSNGSIGSVDTNPSIDTADNGNMERSRAARRAKPSGDVEAQSLIGTGQSSLASSPDEQLPSPAGHDGHERRPMTSWDLAINVGLVGLWYFFSISISIYNKWMFSEPDPSTVDGLAVVDLSPDMGGDGHPALVDRGLKRAFPFPLFTTSFHMVVQFMLSSAVMYVFPSLRPWRRSDQANKNDSSRTDLTPWFYLTKVSPCGAASGVDIGFGNTSLRYITLTFYTMCKSSVLGFTLVFAILLKLYEPTLRLCMIVLVMSLGVFMMAFGETEFSGIGFFLIMTAACSSGLRWALTQQMMKKQASTMNPLSTIFLLSPVMFATLFVLASFIEGLGSFGAGLAEFLTVHGMMTGILSLVFPGVLAFCMTASEFAFLGRVSVVSLAVVGILKEVITFIAAYMVFHEVMTAINLVGVVITILAIIAYNVTESQSEIPAVTWLRRQFVFGRRSE